MEVYDTEEEQVAAIKRWWKENGSSTIIGVVVGAILIAGWDFWGSYTVDKANQASALYDQLLVSSSKGNKDSIVAISKRIMEKDKNSTYASFAALLLAKTKVQENDLDAAKAILEEQMNNANSDELKNIARLRYVRLLYATAEYEQGLKLIAETDQATAEGFSASYDELKGDLYVALDRLGEARTAYESALRDGARTPLLQFKLDDITSAEIITNP